MTYHEHYNIEIEKHPELLYPELLSDILSSYTLALIVEDLGIVITEHPTLGFSCYYQQCSDAIMSNDNWKQTTIWVKKKMLTRLKELDEQIRWELGLDKEEPEETTEDVAPSSDLGFDI